MSATVDSSIGPGRGSEKPYPGKEVTTTSNASSSRAAVRGRVGQQGEQLEVLDERARKAVGEHNRQRVGPIAVLVHEVHPHPVEVGEVVREPVELTLLLTPVELAGPVGEQRAQVAGVNAGLPAHAVDAVRPARSLDPVAQVREHRLVDLDGERFDRDRVCYGSPPMDAR
jgi:hypothetical protein